MRELRFPYRRLHYVNRPLKVGDVIIHKDWSEENTGYYKFLEITSSKYRVVDQSGYENTYDHRAFGLMSDWVFVQEGERKKTGFGSFINRVEKNVD
jgi:hypothetical protein